MLELHKSILEQTRDRIELELKALDSAYLDIANHLQREATLMTLWLALLRFVYLPAEFHSAMLQARQMYLENPEIVSIS